MVFCFFIYKIYIIYIHTCTYSIWVLLQRNLIGNRMTPAAAVPRKREFYRRHENTGEILKASDLIFWLLPSMIFLNWIALFVYDYVPVDGCNFALSGIMCCIYSNVSNVWQVCDDLFLKLKQTYLKQENYTITVWTGRLKGLLVSKHVYWKFQKDLLNGVTTFRWS